MPDLPEPLTPAGCNLRGMGWMPFHGDIVLESDAWLEASPEGRCAIIVLFWAAWKQSGSLPASDRALAQLAGFGAALDQFLAIKAEVLCGWVLCSDGRWHHRMLADLALQSWEKRKTASAGQENAKLRQQRCREERSRLFNELRLRGIKLPWNASLDQLRQALTESKPIASKPGTACHSDGCVTDTVIDKVSYSTSTSLIHVLNKEKEEGERGVTAKAATSRASRPKPAIRLPDDWQPNAEGIALAQNLGLNVAEVTERFCDHFHTTGAQTAKNRDWDRRWIRWCKDDAEKAAEKRTRSMSRMDAREQSAINNQREIDRLTAGLLGSPMPLPFDPAFTGLTIDGELAQ